MVPAEFCLELGFVDVFTLTPSRNGVVVKSASKGFWQIGITYCIAVCLLVGCSGRSGENHQRAKITGSVTYDGESLQYGVINFVPKPGFNLPTGSTEIRNGQYQLEVRGGLLFGTYRVEITGWKQPPDGALATPESTDDPQSGQIVPEKYNTQSTLEVVVSSSAPIRQDYVLER